MTDLLLYKRSWTTATLFFVVGFFWLLAACQKNNNELLEGEKYNDEAYRYYYVSLDSVELYAKMAFDVGKKINDDNVIAEALCHRGFVNYMKMDFVEAENCLTKVFNETSNELYDLFADVLMMKVCQRQSLNRQFYDYHNDAIEKMERLGHERKSMDDRQKCIWNFAVSEFYFTNYIYNYYLRQDEEAEKQLKYVLEHFDLVQNDPAQMAMFYYLIGNSRNASQMLLEKDAENLLEAVKLAKNHELNFILYKSLTSVAADIFNTKQYKSARTAKIYELLDIHEVDGEELPRLLCEDALKVFQAYGSPFDISQTYIALSEYYLTVKNDIDKAFDMMNMALDCVNQHHKRVVGNNDFLYPVTDNQDTIFTEMTWIRNHVPCVPEWMADVREHFSIVFSAMGDKEQSDYNRNVYLDILEEIRQDTKMTQMKESLEKERDELNLYIIMAAIGIVLLLSVVYWMVRRMKKNYQKKYRREKTAVEQEMEQWRKRSDLNFASLEEMEENVNAERIAKERKLEEQKRQYIDKTTCLAIVHAITPFLDRAVNEARVINENLHKVHSGKDNEQFHQNLIKKLEYLNELFDIINLYNDILASWVKIRQGEVVLNIERFDLMPMFEMLKNNQQMFKAKQMTLVVNDTSAVVRADKALTMFMINTLIDNARKYSFEGGTVKVFAEEDGDYVNINVQDQGRGMSKEDVEILTHEKIYDSSKIGDVEHDEELKKNKGFGFGILNCKGIIDKYKKTNPVFKDCKFGVESEVGKGSRFFFRLPSGKLKNTITVVLMAMMMPLTMNAQVVEDDYFANGELPKSHHEQVIEANDICLREAIRYADSVYFANTKRDFEMALNFVDSALVMFNAYYLEKEPNGVFILKRFENNQMPEIELWKQGFKTDYNTLRDIRNEAAVAALALKQWDVYYYNNEIFNRLQKLISSDDKVIEKNVVDIKQANNNKKTLIFIVVILFLLGLGAFYVIYYYNNILPTFDLRLMLELNRNIFNNQDESKLATIIEKGVSEIRRTNGVALGFKNGKILFSENCANKELVTSLIKNALDKNDTMLFDNGKIRICPLNVDENTNIGTIAFLLYNVNETLNDKRLFQQIADYTAVNIFFSSVRMDKLNEDIQLVEDEKRRAEREANIVHVQNLIIDNTLSTIKHETMYYPSRIAQIATKIVVNDNHDQYLKNQDYGLQIFELITYYKDVFTLLRDCAAKQIGQSLFKRTAVDPNDVLKLAEKYTNKFNKKHHSQVVCNSKATDVTQSLLTADRIMLTYLVENIVEAITQDTMTGVLDVSWEYENDFVKFSFCFTGRALSEERIRNLFYPDALQFNPNDGTLMGAQWLIARQIVREHDEHVRRGCRIYAQSSEDSQQLVVCFTIPTKKRA